MGGGYILWRTDAIWTKSWAASVGEPASHSGARVGLAEKIFVVASELGDSAGVCRLHVHDGLNNATAVSAAVDIIAQENEGRRAALRKSATLVEKVEQFVETAIDIADREK